MSTKAKVLLHISYYGNLYLCHLEKVIARPRVLSQSRGKKFACDVGMCFSRFEQKPWQTSGVFDVDLKLGGEGGRRSPTRTHARMRMQAHSWGVNEATTSGLKNHTRFLPGSSEGPECLVCHR